MSAKENVVFPLTAAAVRAQMIGNGEQCLVRLPEE